MMQRLNGHHVLQLKYNDVSEHLTQTKKKKKRRRRKKKKKKEFVRGGGGGGRRETSRDNVGRCIELGKGCGGGWRQRRRKD